ncbi:MAG: dipeptidase [Croceicoccus sp.]|nr:dipeptidase [Croceicoccus sp.]MAL24942.1 dipeptidase [Croceicoccus sp.]|tara:strand:+ start:76597 stop:77736 length:1140 start_codon:yes stop_codon:yes gene_type:complete
MKSTQSRRSALKLSAGAAAAAFMINKGSYALAAAPGRTYSRRAMDLVNEALVIDMLAPLKIDFREDFFDEPFDAKSLEEFKSSGITGFHQAVGLGGFNGKDQAMEYLGRWSYYIGSQSDHFTLVDKAPDLERAKADGKIAVILGIQNADQFQKPADVEYFYRMGLRCAQLTYNSQNFIGSGSTDRVDGGLTNFGAAIVEEMNRVGMLVDVSHCAERTTMDAIEASPKPIAITHSNCRAINPHVRNKSDEAIQMLAAKGGVMGITEVRMFVSKDEPVTVTDMATHIDHVAKLVGIEHVGIGSDSDLNGYDDMPADQNKMLRKAYDQTAYAFREKIDTDGFDHPLKTYDLTEELIRRGYSDENIKLVLGGNFRRLLGDTWI